MSYAKSANFHFFKAQVPSSLKRKCPFKKAQMSYQKAQMSFADLNIKTLTGRISCIIVYTTSLENLSINLSKTFLNTTE
jgi:hypothetical protein